MFLGEGFTTAPLKLDSSIYFGSACVFDPRVKPKYDDGKAAAYNNRHCTTCSGNPVRQVFGVISCLCGGSPLTRRISGRWITRINWVMTKAISVLSKLSP